MNSIKKLLLTILVSCPMLLLAQDFDNYQPLRSSGEIPEAFIKKSSVKYQEAINNNTSSTIKEFHLESNFGLDELLASGQVLFNDPISKYVSSVADEILKDDPDTRQKLTFYTIKSVSVNAFATDRGEIFVNTGLLANLNTEAELAFILCHEIQHFVLQHNLNSYVIYDKIQKGQGVYKRQKKYDKLVSQHSYTRTLEREADEKGLELFLKSKYSINDIDHVFEVLAKAHVTHKNEPFDYSFLETGTIKFPEKYKLKKVNPIVAHDDDDDELSTHPSVKSRKKKVLEALEDESNDGKKSFVVSENEFKRVQKIAAFELCHILLSYRSYPAAIYHAFLIDKIYNESNFSKKVVTKALYGYAQYKNSDRLEEISSNPDSIQGEMQHVFHLLDKLPKKELNVLASRFCFDAHKAFPDDQAMKYTAKDMVEDMIIYAIHNPDKYFKKKLPKQKIVDKENAVTKANSTPAQTKVYRTFAKYAFIDILEDSTFQKMIADGKKFKQQFDQEDPDNMSSSEAYSLYKKRKKEQENKRKKGRYLGIDSVLFVNPVYVKIDGRKKQGAMKHLESEKLQLKYKDWIDEFSKKLGLNSQVLDQNHIGKKSTVEDYNDIIRIDNWVEEMLDHEMYMICSNYNDVLPIVKKYNTNKFVYTGTYHYRGKKSALTQAGNVIMLVTPFTLPAGAYHLFKPNYNTIYFTLVLDFNRQRVLMSDINYTNSKDRELLVKNNLYWSILQIKRDKK